MSERVVYISKNVKSVSDDRYLPQVEIHKCGKVTLAEWKVPMRALPLWHIYWNSNSGGKLILPKQEIEMQPDTIYMLPPYLAFATASNAVFDHVYLDFSMRSNFFSQVRKEVIEFPFAEYSKVFECCFRGNFSVLTSKALIFLLLDAIPPEYFEHTAAHAIDQRIQQALELIFEAFQSDGIKKLDNRTISREIGMSPVNFQHLFKREMQISPHRYILNLRLEAAHDLLKNSSKRIEEIAASAGFANRYQFSKSFTQLYGIPPGRLRKNNRNSPDDADVENRSDTQ